MEVSLGIAIAGFDATAEGFHRPLPEFGEFYSTRQNYWRMDLLATTRCAENGRAIYRNTFKGGEIQLWNMQRQRSI
jgi:hypothetical protein